MLRWYIWRDTGWPCEFSRRFDGLSIHVFSLSLTSSPSELSVKLDEKRRLREAGEGSRSIVNYLVSNN